MSNSGGESGRSGPPGNPDVAVIGAGLAGLLCAATLAERGFDVDIFDASDGVGGRVRTDVVDGFRCDRGFQLLNPAYPAVARYVDVDALDLHTFAAGVAVTGVGGIRVVADPRRSPELLARTTASGYLRPWELARLARWAAPALGPVGSLLGRADTDLTEALAKAKIKGRIRSEILEPFLTGVLGTPPGGTSATFVRLLLRSFLLATPGVPAAGMAALPAQLAGRLTSGVRLGVSARGITAGGGGLLVDTDAGPVRARAVVVAVDPAASAVLAPVAAPRMNGLTTYWFQAAEPPTPLKLLFVDSGGRSAGPVVNTAVMSNVAPGYAPPGRHLVQATTLWPESAGEAEVRQHLGRMYGTSASNWDLLVRHDIERALPSQPPPLVRAQPVDLGGGLFVAGDHRDTASIQGALVSGRRAANAVTGRLRGHRARRPGD